MKQAPAALERGQETGADFRIGIALGGGAAKGLAHIGVLRALVRGGVFPDGIAGTSMGALVGAFFCRDRGMEQAEQAALKLASERLVHTFPLHPRRGGLLSQGRVAEILASEFDRLRIQDLPLPFYCTGTDLAAGKRAVFTRGSVVTALLASSAIPVVFPPVRHQGRFYVDGGVINPVPTGVLRENRYDFIIAVNVFHRHGRSPVVRRPKAVEPGAGKAIWSLVERMVARHVQPGKNPGESGVLGNFVQTFEIMQQALIESQLQHDGPDVVLQVDTRDFSFHEFDRAAEIIARGEETGQRLLEYVKQGLALKRPAVPGR